MEITFATRSDAEGLLDIFEELERYYFGDKAASRSEIITYLYDGLFAAHSGVQVVVAVEHNVILGFATFAILYPAPKLAGQAYLKDLFTANRARGKGVGTKLMKFIAQYALEHGCNRLDWTAETTNPIAGAFYHSIGAELVTEKQYFRFEDERLRSFAKT